MISSGLRSRLGQIRFVKELKKFKREREIVSFNEATKIGLLYDATDERDSEIIKNYVKNLRSNLKKDVLSMGYIDKKIAHPTQYAQFGLDFFTKKDLTFQMIPSDPIVKNFINERFDILINLNIGKNFPLRYISAQSKAKFKVGCFQNNLNDHLDMMIKLDSGTPLKSIIEEIEHYLRIIHKP
jgi:hypothetical protein